MEGNSDNLFEAVEKTKKRILKNPIVLNPDYYPEKLLFRENEIKEIVSNIYNFIAFDIKRHLLIYGPKGTGKTHTLHVVKRSLYEYLEKKNINNVKMYIISAKNLTYFKCLEKIVRVITGKEQRVRDPNKYEIMLNDLFENGDTKYIIALDDMDSLQATKTVKNPVDRLIYAIVKPDDVTKYRKVLLITVMNSWSTEKSISDTTMSAFSPYKIMFDEYNADQLKKILLYRCKEAFHDGAIEYQVIAELAGIIKREARDLRWALRVLEVAADMAETKVNMETLRKAIEAVDKDALCETITSMKGHAFLVFYSLIILNKIKRKDDYITTGEMYRAYSIVCDVLKIRPVTQKHIVDYIIPSLDDKGLILKYNKGHGRGRGRSFVYTLPPYPDYLYDLIDSKMQIEYEAPSEYVSENVLKRLRGYRLP